MTDVWTPGDGCPPLSLLERLAQVNRTLAEPVLRAVIDHVEHCTSCSGLVSDLQSDEEFLASVVEACGGVSSISEATTDAPSIEGYRIDREIHRGGQGVIYEGVHLATHRQVAIKTLLRGTFATTRQRLRFEREVEVAARLRHPGIITIYDSGHTTDGADYLAMEFVDGKRLDAYDWQRADVPSILRTVASIAEAAHHAHQRGVIHRDLKPANILIDEAGEPRVLDFGIAKSLQERTSSAPEVQRQSATLDGEFVGTFAYASPEQITNAADEIDVRTDIYSIGVILYEMLSGKSLVTQARSMGELVRQITDARPASVKGTRPGLTEDVQTILFKALAKDRDRRYQSAGALAEDIRLCLANRPINARRDSTTYVVLKTLARYKMLTASLSAAGLLLVAYLVTMPLLYQNALDERAAKVQEAEKATRVVDSIADALSRVDQETSNIAVNTIADFLTELRRITTAELELYPLKQADVEIGIGMAYLNREDFASAEQSFRNALMLREANLSPDDLDIAEACHHLARTYYKQTRFADALPLYERALVIRERGLMPSDGALSVSHHHIAATLAGLGRFEQAHAHFQRTVALREAAGLPLEAALNTRHSIAMCLREEGRFAEAIELLESIEREMIDLVGADDWRIARLRHTLATVLIDVGETSRATVVLEQVIDLTSRANSDQVLELARAYTESARIHAATGDSIAAGLGLAGSALQRQRERLADPHLMTAESLLVLARLDLRMNRAAEAIEWASEALSMREALLPPGHWRIAEAQTVLALALVRTGSVAEAASLAALASKALSGRAEDDPYRQAAHEARTEAQAAVAARP